MSILRQKLLSRLHEEAGKGGDAGGGAGGDNLQREQEIEASKKGWVPEHRYKGPQGQWKDAATFLAFEQETRRGMSAQITELKNELAEFKGTAKQFAEFQQRQIEQRDGEIAGLQRDLKQQLRQAVRDGDDAAADAIESRIELLDEEREKSKKQLTDTKQDDAGKGGGAAKVDPAQGIDENGHTTNPMLVAFINDGNQWMRDSKPMREYSFAVAAELIQNGETRRGEAFLAVIREKMEEAFPRYFGEGKGNPNNRGSVGGSTDSGGSGSGNYTEADLPEADKDLMRLGIRQGWTSKETFLKNYFSDGPRIHTTAAKK